MRVIRAIIPFLCLFWLVCGLHSPPVMAHMVVPETKPTAVANASQLEAIIKDRLDYYNKTYPEIRFVQVSGGEDWHGDMVAILTMLATNPDPLDYAHPPDLRETLLAVTLERLRRFLEADVVSATLFRVGQDSVVDRPNLCVITLNPEVFVANDYEATRYMLDVPEAAMKKIHPARYLDHEHHLEFTLDHEAFHCLDSYFNGGVPQTDKELGGEYNLFRRESIADAYALIMHIRKHGGITSYARNIVHARALWLFSDSPNRCTFETIREVLNYDHEAIRATPVKQLIALVTHIRNKTVGEYEAYVVQRAAAVNAAEKAGMEVRFYGEQWSELTALSSNPALVEHLLNRYDFYYHMLFSDTPIPMEAPPRHEWKK